MRSTKQSGNGQINSSNKEFGLRRTALALAIATALGLGAVDTFAVPTSTLSLVPTTGNASGVGAGATDTQSATHDTPTANVVAVAGTSAVTTITIDAPPAPDSTLTIGSCVVTFKAGNNGASQDSFDCTSDVATIDLTVGGPSAIARTASELAAVMSSLTNVNGGAFGALTLTGYPGGGITDVVFTSANKVAGYPTVTLPTGITDVDSTPGVATEIAAVQEDTITIGGTIETGDVFTANLPGPVTATYTALNGDDANAVATGLNDAILASSGYAGQAFDSTVLTNVVTLTAKAAGTGFTVTSGATNYAGAGAVAQQDTLTPAIVTVGETFVVDIGGTKYAHVATTTSPDAVVAGLTNKITADGSSVVTPSGSSTLILTANIAGTPFTATPSVIGVADAAHSTLAITSSSLTVGGATTTATLTLKDVDDTPLIDVSGSGATITSGNAAVFTVGAPTRSSSAGTVTATVTAAGAGSTNLTATLNGSAAVTQTQSVTVAAAAVVDSGSTSTPNTTPPTVVTVPTDVTVPTGTTLTPVGSVSTVFTGSTGSGVTVSGGSIVINTSSITPGTSPLVLSSSVPEGTGIVLNAQTSGSNTPPPPVNLTIGGQTLELTPSSTGNTLLSTTMIQVNGQPQQALTVLSGSASLSASATDQVLCTVPSLNNNSPVVISSNSNSSSTLVTSSPSGSTITPGSGSVQLIGASLTDYSVTVTADHHALITKFLIGSDSINHFSAASAGSFTLYAGETLTLNPAGQVTAITVTSSSGKGGAGDAITAPAPLTFNGSVPLLNATSARLGKKLQQGVADALGASLNGDQSSSGVLSLSTAGGTVTVLPVGAVRINPNDTDGLGLGSDGLIYVTRSGITVGFAPSVADPVQFAADIAKILPGATVSISTSGAFVVKAGNATYAVQPAWTASKSTGTAGFSTGSDGALRYLDAQGNQSVLLPAFIDSYAAQQIVAAAVTGSTATVNTDGTITLKVGSVSYTLTPDLGLATVNSTGVPSVLEGKKWWVDSGKLFLNTTGGVQGVNVR